MAAHGDSVTHYPLAGTARCVGTFLGFLTWVVVQGRREVWRQVGMMRALIVGWRVGLFADALPLFLFEMCVFLETHTSR